MTYTFETRPDASITQRMLKSTEMEVLRRCTNKTLRARERSEDISCTCNIENIIQWIRGRKMEWDQHIERMTNNRIVRKVRDKSPKGKQAIAFSYKSEEKEKKGIY